jgi:hypothetical protein
MKCKRAEKLFDPANAKALLYFDESAKIAGSLMKLCR